MSADRNPNPKAAELRRQFESERLVAQGECPDCGGSLDTGWECNACGADFAEVALSMPVDRYERLSEGA